MTNKEKQIIEEFEERYDHLNPIYDDGKSIPTWSSGDFDDMKDFILKALKAQRKEIVEKIEIGIDEIFSKRKEVCTCPKGGMYGDEVCSDCGGTEWALSKELKEIGQEIKNLIKEDE